MLTQNFNKKGGGENHFFSEDYMGSLPHRNDKQVNHKIENSYRMENNIVLKQQ